MTEINRALSEIGFDGIADYLIHHKYEYLGTYQIKLSVYRIGKKYLAIDWLKEVVYDVEGWKIEKSLKGANRYE